MSSEPFVGTICVFGGNFAPVGWLPCDGRLLPIAQYEVLYTLLGTTYGGDGQSTFGLPNLKDSTMVHMGQRTGGSNYVMGQKAGTNAVTVTANNLPPHTHTV